MGVDELAHLQQQIGRLRLEVHQLYRHLNLELPPEADADTYVTPEILELVRAGDILTAIKTYRNETGCDLATAKRRIESLQSS